jgi:hypothetical protein
VSVRPKPSAVGEAAGPLPRKRDRLAAELLADFRAGRHPEDRTFDRVLARNLRLASPTHWTPIEVIARVSEWIDRHGIRSVVDVGAGAGKFCVVAALLTRCRFVGIEQRAWLVDAARELARVMRVEDRVRVVHSTLGEEPLPSADAYYFFNPFGENLFDVEDSLGADVEHGLERRTRDVKAAKAALDDRPLGTYVITYNGFGGRMPPRYGEIDVDRELPNVLRLWRKDSQ